MLFCSFCAENVPRAQLLKHVEENHVGAQSTDNLYHISCGACSFRVCEREREKLIDHCFKTGHGSSGVRLDWKNFISEETARVEKTIKAGVELLAENSGKSIDKSSAENVSSFASTASISHPFDVAFSPASCEDSQGADPENDVANAILADQYTVDCKSHIAIKSEQIIALDHEGSIRSVEEPRISENGQENHHRFKKRSFIQEEQEIEGTRGAKTSRHDSSEQSFGRYGGLGVGEMGCSKCGKSVSFGRKNLNKINLMVHAVAHSKLKFIKCADCGQEFGAIQAAKSHSTRKSGNCSRKWHATLTEEKKKILREELKNCFPSINFDAPLTSGSFIGLPLQMIRGAIVST